MPVIEFLLETLGGTFGILAIIFVLGVIGIVLFYAGMLVRAALLFLFSNTPLCLTISRAIAPPMPNSITGRSATSSATMRK